MGSVVVLLALGLWVSAVFTLTYVAGFSTLFVLAEGRIGISHLGFDDEDGQVARLRQDFRDYPPVTLKVGLRMPRSWDSLGLCLPSVRRRPITATASSAWMDLFLGKMVLPMHETLIVMPGWLPVVAGLVPVTLFWWRDRRIPPGHCQRCGYDLTGNVSGRCPECGEPVSSGDSGK